MANEIYKIKVGTSDYPVRDNRVLTLTDASTTAGTWVATAPNLSAYTDGQLFLYTIVKAGASTTTLNINSIGAKTVYVQGATKLNTQFAVGSTILLVYSSGLNSGCFMVVNYYDTNSNTVPAAMCTTAAATAAKTASHDYYTATSNTYDLVTIRYANTSASAITLNINSQGAKPIYINGSASSASNYTLPAGTYLVFYDGTNYYFRTDGKLQKALSADTATTASKLGTSTVGSATKGIYLNGGTATAMTYSLNKDVPSNAVFTDTHNKHAVISGLKADGSTTITGASSDGNLTMGDSGVTAGEYGPTSNQTPGYNSTFNVPDIKVNAKGIVTSATNRTVKIPASDNTNQTVAVNSATFGVNAAVNFKDSDTVKFSVSSNNVTAAVNLPGVMRFVGVGQTAEPTAGTYIHDATTGYYIPRTETGTKAEVAAAIGDLYAYGVKEYVFTTAGTYATPNASREIGDETRYAIKGSETGSSAPGTTTAGTHTHSVSVPSVTRTISRLATTPIIPAVANGKASKATTATVYAVAKAGTAVPVPNVTGNTEVVASSVTASAKTAIYAPSATVASIIPAVAVADADRPTKTVFGTNTTASKASAGTAVTVAKAGIAVAGIIQSNNATPAVTSVVASKATAGTAKNVATTGTAVTNVLRSSATTPNLQSVTASKVTISGVTATCVASPTVVSIIPAVKSSTNPTRTVFGTSVSAATYNNEVITFTTTKIPVVNSNTDVTVAYAGTEVTGVVKSNAASASVFDVTASSVTASNVTAINMASPTLTSITPAAANGSITPYTFADVTATYVTSATVVSVTPAVSNGSITPYTFENVTVPVVSSNTAVTVAKAGTAVSGLVKSAATTPSVSEVIAHAVSISAVTATKTTLGTALSITPAVSNGSITTYTFGDVDVAKAGTSTTVATGSVSDSGAGATVTTGVTIGSTTANTDEKGGHSHTVNSHTHTQK